MSGDDASMPMIALDVQAEIAADERKRVADFLRAALTSGESIDIDKLADAVADGTLTLEAIKADEPPAPAVTVQQLLKDSWTAHKAAAELRRQRVGRGQVRPYIERALELRLQAHELDPDHRDSAWVIEGMQTARGVDTHDALVTFYRQQLAAPAVRLVNG